MKVISRLVCLVLLFTVTQLGAATTSGTITSSETWSGTVSLTGDLTLQGGTLTIQPGTMVRLNGNEFNIKGAGIIKAIGTAGNRITFTGGETYINELTNDNQCLYQYCDFLNNFCLVHFLNSDGQPQSPAMTTMKFDNCLFKNGGYCLMYVTSGGSAIISNSHFEDAASGIFIHGGDVIDVSYTSFTNVSCGILSASMGSTRQPYEPLQTKVNHCVFYDIDNSRVPSGIRVASGYAIETQNYAGVLTVRNSIFQNITFSSIRDWNVEDPNCTWGYWTVVTDYNCHYMLGGAPIRLKTMGSHSMETNPRMTNPAGGDYSLQSTSPCRNQASDGSHIGKWQEAGIRDRFRSDLQNRIPVTLSENPFSRSISFKLDRPERYQVAIYSNDQDLVRNINLADRNGYLRWDGCDQYGNVVSSGVYYALISDGVATITRKIVKLY